MEVRVYRQYKKPPPPTFRIELTRTEARTLELILNTVDKTTSSLAQNLRNELHRLLEENPYSLLGPDGY